MKHMIFKSGSLLTALLFGSMIAIPAMSQTPNSSQTLSIAAKNTKTITGTNTKTGTNTINQPKSSSAISAPQNSNTIDTSAGAPEADTKPAAKTAAANTDAQDFIYTNDSDTDNLQRAIEDYNRRFPNAPIILESGSLSEDIITRLMRAELLKKAPAKPENLRIREGRIFRRLPREQVQNPTETGTTADSLLGTFDGASTVLNQDAKKGKGNTDAPNVRVEIRQTEVRSPNGETKEVTYVVPSIPKQPVRKGPTGPHRNQLPNALSRQILSKKYIAVPDDAPSVASQTTTVNSGKY
ncbi:MAG: hypothetical protein HQM09_12500 [Candidatus Riflebacteria bacterium]|nr:hypothetical protein [Candidatus Riflebacteria bacterium]